MIRLNTAHPLYLAPIARSDEPPHDLHDQDDGEPAGEATELGLLTLFAIVSALIGLGVLILVGVLSL